MNLVHWWLSLALLAAVLLSAARIDLWVLYLERVLS